MYILHGRKQDQAKHFYVYYGVIKVCLQDHTTAHNTTIHNPAIPRDIILISQNCSKHNEKYTIYCKKHECPCCSGCIVENHNECRNLAKLADFIKKNKPSNAFCEMEHSLEELVNNFKAIRHDQQNNLQMLARMKSQIDKEIKETRITINNHLDEIQNDIMEKLNAVEEEENTKLSHC
ncbi:unnamed protein product [Mytilus coruscus]|uniref:B box-type domain-containing protein n=1 Tax=Mytilus coruscus TaxID=42192 RepID=A0A6J8B9I3_MYTCO|nr:unnamed protein product [Mytilus coruscus]